MRLVVQAVTRSVELPPSPDLDAGLTRVQGADVFLFFIESYGAITFEKPEFNDRLQEPRALFDRAIHDTGRDVVSPWSSRRHSAAPPGLRTSRSSRASRSRTPI